jgi:hypothetical protein
VNLLQKFLRTGIWRSELDLFRERGKNTTIHEAKILHISQDVKVGLGGISQIIKA